MSQFVVDITRIVRDEGTIVVMEGVREGSLDIVEIAVDHRMARSIVEGFNRGEQVHAWAEGWQVLSSRKGNACSDPACPDRSYGQHGHPA